MAEQACKARDKAPPLVVELLYAPLGFLLLLGLLAWVPLRAFFRVTCMKLLGQWPRPYGPEDADLGFDVICLSHVAWTHIWQRNHHTMTRLAKRHRVTYLQVLPTSYVHVFARTFPRTWPEFFGRHEEVKVRQVLLLPGDTRLAAIHRFNDWMLGVDVRWQAWRMGLRRAPVLWFYHPAGVGVLEHVKPAAVVYDIQDEYTAFRRAARGVAQRERRLLEAADIIFAGTHELYVKKSRNFAGDAYFYPCAVEFEHFHRAAPGSPDPPAEPPELAGVGRPRLLYVGLIDGRIDAELIERLAEADPSWQIVMVGPVEVGGFPASEIARRHPNVHFTDRKPYGRLPEFLCHSDLYLMPWRVNELTLHINPTKTLEYLAAGRPVVSVRLPDLEVFFGDTVALASPERPEEFIQLVRDALAGRKAEAVAAGIEKARSLSWEAVVGEMEDHIRKVLARRAGLEYRETTRCTAVYGEVKADG